MKKDDMGEMEEMFSEQESWRPCINSACDQVEFKRISLAGFTAALDVLITGASQSRQHDKSESSLFDVGSGRISIIIVNTKYETTKELWEAILKTFGGNEATKKTKKNQLKQQYGNFKAEEWLMYNIVWRNRDDLDTVSLDDVYNHLKLYEPEVQKKSESNSQNMTFIYSANTSSGKGEINTASIPTASTQVSTASANVAAASISHDTIDKDDIKEMDIKWNMALLSMRADRFWKKTGKKITIQGTHVAGFDKSKVESFTCHKIGHFARECRAPRSQDRGRRESYKQGSKEEESALKALMAIDGIRWDWSYMADEEESHALVADEEAPIEFALMAKSSSSFENEVEARLVEFKTQEIKFFEKIKGLEFDVEVKNNKIKHLMNELEQVKKEKDRLDSKLTGFESASKDLDTLLGSHRTDKNKEGLGYSVVPPSCSSLLSSQERYVLDKIA
nr:hypothetical protein [Tanacetum cinerariifolium]